MELEYEGCTTAKPWLDDMEECTPKGFNGIPSGN